MAVYTRLSTEEIKQHLLNYKIGELIEYTEIIEGIDNSNFILETTSGKFILTVFESRIKKDELPFFINFKSHLAKKGICCPKPLENNSGNIISDLKGKKSCIVTFLKGSNLKSFEGYQDNITDKHCFEVGKILAQLHQASMGFESSRFNDLGNTVWKEFFAKFKKLTQEYQKNLQLEIEDNISFLKENWVSNLPSCPSHLDLFPDNVFFDDKSEVSGVIDFYFAANDLVIYDFAIAVNAWCFDKDNNFIETRFDKMLAGYESVRKFSLEEKNFLTIACLGAAMRFLLTRLHDMFFTPKDSIVNIKNPQEYLAKLRFFRSKL
ncbi:MAG: homoserine kinase [Pelagibacterales bacterium]|nr:homoserine kinase [Pelagibacterales bacterium]